MLDIVFLIVLGVLAGVFTGITPGIHPNTVIFGFLPFYFVLEVRFLYFMTFLAALSVSHTFHDFLPAIFLGAPEADTAMASLPGVEMAANGKGVEAFHYSLFGGLFSVTTMVFMIPLVFLGLETVYPYLESLMEYILLFFVLVLIFNSDDTFASALVTVMAGLLGVISFSMPVNNQYVLVPVFSGLFALPAIVTALRSSHEIPEQEESNISRDSAFRGGILGCGAGIFTGMFPGMSPAVSTSFFVPFMEREEEFLASMGGVNTADIVMTFISIYLIGKARSGAAVALQAIATISPEDITFLLGVSFFSIGISLFIAYFSPKLFTAVLRNISVVKVLIGVILVLFSVVYLLTGVLGILILLTGGFIGYYAALRNERGITMSVLLVPSIVYFSGLTGII